MKYFVHFKGISASDTNGCVSLSAETGFEFDGMVHVQKGAYECNDLRVTFNAIYHKYKGWTKPFFPPLYVILMWIWLLGFFLFVLLWQMTFYYRDLVNDHIFFYIMLCILKIYQMLNLNKLNLIFFNNPILSYRFINIYLFCFLSSTTDLFLCCYILNLSSGWSVMSYMRHIWDYYGL